MRRYEMVLVAAPTVPEESLDQQISNIEQMIADGGGVVHKVDRWGRRKLAFTVRRFNEGNYTLVLYDADPAVEKEVLRRVKLTDAFIRFLSVRADHEQPPTAEEKAALEEARREHLRRAAERAAMADAAEDEQDVESEPEDEEDEESDDDDDRQADEDDSDDESGPDDAEEDKE
ncbi:MAG: 30S ribosomal protein S6 [Acidobacteriota bacterium]|nr:MAG: 30S ribosomal protein S6 [Acidobacteriota bacterium]